MNKLGKSLLVASLVVGAMKADTYTNKTFLAGRPVGVNLAMESTTWSTQTHKIEGNEDKFGASFQAVGFYQENTNEDSLGKYFGFDDKRTLVVGNGGLATTDIDKRNLLHDVLGIRASQSPNWPAATTGSGSTAFSGRLNLEMNHKAAGIRLDYFQELDGLVKGMYLKVRAPIIWEETEAKLNLSSSVSATINGNPAGAAGDFLDGVDSLTVNIANYFCGSITQTAATGAYSNKQAVLTHAKICGSHSKTSLADIDLLLGWSFYETEDNHAGINLGVTIPTGPVADGVWLFESRGGANGGHWGLGAGFDTKFVPWKKDEQKLEILAMVDWRYLFKNDEKRTLQLIGKEWSQYFLLGQTGETGVIPAANILTREVDVRPGNQVDALFGLAYRSGNFTADLGYNLYAREAEKVSVKEALPESTYGIAGRDYDAVNAFSTTYIAASNHSIGSAQAAAAGGQWIKNSDLDTLPATTPAQITHKLYGGFGWAWNDWDTPVMLGLGASYEFASSQKALETWALWGKLGISF